MFPGHIPGSKPGDRPAVAVDDEAEDHLLEIGAIVLGIAVLAKRLAALAVERQAGGVHEHRGEVGKEIAAQVEQRLLDLVFHAARRERFGRLLRNLLAEPGHGAVEVMQLEPIGARDVVVLHPRRAVAIRARDQQAVQRGDEHGALDRKPEPALLQQIIENHADPQSLPDSAKQHRPADPLRRNRQCRSSVLVERADEQHLIGELCARSDQRGECSGGGQFIGAAEIGDDLLADGCSIALVLDDLHVAALAGLLQAEEHGGSPIEHHGIRVDPNHQAQKLGGCGTTFCENHPSPQTISMPYRRRAAPTVQVGPDAAPTFPDESALV